jgi:hypothetical protein
MNKMSMTLSKLMKELQVVEKIIKPKSTVLLSKVSSSRTKPKVKKWRKTKGDAFGSVGTGSNAKPKGKCFKCGKKGHWKNECLDFLTQFSYLNLF